MKTKRLEIKKAGLVDLPELETVEQECDIYFSFDPPCEENHTSSIRDCLLNGDLPPNGVKENYHFLTVQHDKNLIGFLAYYLGYPHNTAAYISVLYISEAQRSSGFGSEVVGCLVEHFKALGMREIRLHVSLRNTTAMRFWVEKGFDRIVKVRGAGNLLPGAFAGIELQYSYSL